MNIEYSIEDLEVALKFYNFVNFWLKSKKLEFNTRNGR